MLQRRCNASGLWLSGLLLVPAVRCTKANGAHVKPEDTACVAGQCATGPVSLPSYSAMCSWASGVLLYPGVHLHNATWNPTVLLLATLISGPMCALERGYHACQCNDSKCWWLGPCYCMCVTVQWYMEQPRQCNQCNGVGPACC